MEDESLCIYGVSYKVPALTFIYNFINKHTIQLIVRYSSANFNLFPYLMFIECVCIGLLAHIFDMTHRSHKRRIARNGE